jgi:hypothetical protein
MRLRIFIAVAAMSVAALAQRAGSIPAGTFPSGRPASTAQFGTGRSASSGGRGQMGFGRRASPWPVVPWFFGPASAPTWFYPPFENGPYDAGIDPPDLGVASLMDPPQQSAVEAAGPVPAIRPGGAKLGNLPAGCSASSGEQTVFHLQQTPIPSPVVQDEYPPVIVLKTGGAYSATKYWVKNGNLYFVTTQGESRYAPLALVDRVYPREKNGHIAPE